MKMMFVVALALVAAAAAAPQGQRVGASASASAGAPAPVVASILRSAFEQQPEGGYLYNFESDDGIKKEENGELKEVLDEDNKPQTVVVVRGQYSYTDPDGKEQSIVYYADETGFHAEGEAIPKAAR